MSTFYSATGFSDELNKYILPSGENEKLYNSLVAVTKNALGFNLGPILYEKGGYDCHVAVSKVLGLRKHNLLQILQDNFYSYIIRGECSLGDVSLCYAVEKSQNKDVAFIHTGIVLSPNTYNPITWSKMGPQKEIQIAPASESQNYYAERLHKTHTNFKSINFPSAIFS